MTVETLIVSQNGDRQDAARLPRGSMIVSPIPSRSRRTHPGPSPYFAWGFVGYVVATAVTAVLGHVIGLPRGALVVVLLAPPLSFLVVVKCLDLILGYERIVFYELAMAAIAVSAVSAVVTGQPVATVIDLATIGIGTFLVFGRLGCLHTGCCHGRVARRGIRYRSPRACAHLPQRLAGTPLIPVQAIEGAVSAMMVVVACAAMLRGGRPGMAACTYAVGYATSRALLERWRGDADRAHWFRVSEAQWISICILIFVSVWSKAWWSTVALSGAVLVAVVGARSVEASLLSAAHLDEIESHLGTVKLDGILVRTRVGVALSSARLPDGRRDFVVTWPGMELSYRHLRQFVMQMGTAMPPVRVVEGQTPSTWHFVEQRGLP